MMFALALALQTAPPLLQDPHFLAVSRAWIACGDRVVDAGSGSERSDEALADMAVAACTAELGEVRRAVIAFSGERAARGQMAALIEGNREGLINRARERRAREAAAGGSPDARIRAWTACLVRETEAVPAEAEEGAAIDAVFDRCAGEEQALRRVALNLGSASQANEFIRRSRRANRETMLEHLRERRGQQASH